MKYKKLIVAYTAIMISCSNTLSFANQIKTIKKGNSEYVPLEDIVKKAGGNFNKSSNDIDIKVDNKIISLNMDNSFAKINERYYPIKTIEIDGLIVPKDIKPIQENKKVYIDKDFLKNQKLIDYKIQNNIVTINSSTNIQTTISNIHIDLDNDTQQITQTRPNNNNTSNNRPSRPSGGNSSNNTGNTTPSRPNKENSNNNISNNRPNTENNSSNNNSDSNSGNTQQPPIIQDTEQPTPPETPSDSPLGDSSSEEVSENITE